MTVEPFCPYCFNTLHEDSDGNLKRKCMNPLCRTELKFFYWIKLETKEVTIVEPFNASSILE